MKKYFIILLMAMLPTLALAQQAGQHITRPGKAKPKTEKPATPKKKTGIKHNSGSRQSAPPSVSSYTDSYGNKVFNIGNVQFTMVKVDGGTFMMGATSEQGSEIFDSEKPAHKVTLSSYYIGQTEVTQELWQVVMGKIPSEETKGPRLPITHATWNDCQTFINKLNSLTGENFKLPTEAQWEFAARGGNKSRGYRYSGSNNLDDVAWYSKNSPRSNLDEPSWYRQNPGKPYRIYKNVATKQPNELGLYDMSGNAWEWCYDWQAPYSSSAQTDPIGPSSPANTTPYRIYRGGSLHHEPKFNRVAFRSGDYPHCTYQGLRLAL